MDSGSKALIESAFDFGFENFEVDGFRDARIAAGPDACFRQGQAEKGQDPAPKFGPWVLSGELELR